MRGLTHLRFGLSVTLSLCSIFILKKLNKSVYDTWASTINNGSTTQHTQSQIELDEKLNQAGKGYYDERACRQM